MTSFGHAIVYALNAKNTWIRSKLIRTTSYIRGAPGKCELYEILMDEYFNIFYLQTSILNHHTFLFSFCAVLPVPIVFPPHNVTDSAGTDIPPIQVLDLFLDCNNSKAYKATSV